MSSNVITCDTATLQRIFDCSDRHIRDMSGGKKGNILVRVGRGEYDLIQSVQNYIAMETLPRTRAGRESVSLGNEELETAILREELEAKALKNAALRRELIPRQQIEPFILEMTSIFRQTLLDNHAVAAPDLTTAALAGGLIALGGKLKQIDDDILEKLNRELILDDKLESQLASLFVEDADDSRTDAVATADDDVYGVQ